MTVAELRELPFGTIVELRDGTLLLLASYGIGSSTRWTEDDKGTGRYWREVELAFEIKDWVLP